MSALATLSNPTPTDSPGAGVGSSSTTSGGSSNNVERRCESADCSVIKLVSMVPKRKITQFVTEPSVMEKPMLINGFTTVFQVEGNSAKLSDLKNPNPTKGVEPKTIFRIVPNTHAHIVNYVVVDADGDSLRKINEGDPATMRKLLESQKVSADQMLKKLMAGHGPSVPIVCNAAPMPTGVNTITSTAPLIASATTNTVAVSATTTPTISTATPNANVRANPTTSPAVTPGGSAAKASAIQLPMRMHPNLKITAVASRENFGQLVESNLPTQQPLHMPAPAVPTVPLITPVPLANLQSSPVVAAAAAAGATTVDKPNIDKMQAELAELRRTVAMLAEAMPMNPQAQKALQQTSSQQPPRAMVVKRQRLS